MDKIQPIKVVAAFIKGKCNFRVATKNDKNRRAVGFKETPSVPN